jgi:beta-mannosidase
MEHKDSPVALHAVNDSLADLGMCTAEYLVTAERGEAVTKGRNAFHLGPDSHVRIADLRFPVDGRVTYQVSLDLRGPNGKELAHNTYRDPFHHPERAPGYPERMDHEIGMRLWWAARGRQQ